MSLKNKEKPTTLLTDKAAEKSKRTVNFLLVLMMMFQLIFPVAMSVSASSENDADNPGSEEVQEENIESPMTTMQAVEDEGDNNEAEETAQEPAETPPAPAEETPPADEGVTEPVAPENTEEQSNAPPAEEAPAEAPEEVEIPEAEEDVEEEAVEEVTKENMEEESAELQAAMEIGPMSVGPTSFPTTPTFSATESYFYQSGDFSYEGSTNSHTQVRAFWIGTDGHFYMAFRVHNEHAPRDLADIKLNGQNAIAFEVYDTAHQILTVTENGNSRTTSAGYQGTGVVYHWVVADFGTTLPSGSMTITMIVHAPGHDLGTKGDFRVVIPYQDISVKKIWEGKIGESVKLVLKETTTNNPQYTREVLLDGTEPVPWQYTFTDVPMARVVNRQSVSLNYTIDEIEIDGVNINNRQDYSVVVTGNEFNGFTITNTYQIQQVNFTAKKIWVGGPEANKNPVALTLWRRTGTNTPTQVTDNEYAVTPTAGPANEFSYTWTNLPLETTDGTEYEYFFTEPIVEGYSRTYSASIELNVGNERKEFGKFEGNTGTVTNTYQIQQKNIEAKKHWIGGETARPDLWFQLWRKGVNGDEAVPNVDPAILPTAAPTHEASVSVTFSDIEQTDNNGNAYEFYVKEGFYVDGEFEEAVPENFIKSGDKLELTNTYQIPTEDIHTIKYWENGENVRPDLWYQLRRKLIINNEELSDVPVGIQAVPNSGATVDITFEDVEQTDFNGNKYDFYVVEGIYDGETFTAIEESTVYEDFLVERVNDLTFRNSYQVAQTTATATKQWVGSDPNAFEEVEFTLWRTQKTEDFTPGDFEEVEVIPTVIQSTEDPSVYSYSWSVERTDSAGNVYQYYFTEENIPAGFERIYSNEAIEVGGIQYEPSGGTITNKQMTIDFSFTKVNESGEPLQGAEFTLESEDGELSITNTGTDPEFIFAGLTEGRYLLRETKAPSGYSLPTQTWLIEVIRNEETGVLEVKVPDNSFFTVSPEGITFENKEQGEFPQTGGIGVASYIGVGMLAIMSSIGFYIKKEKNGGYQNE